jgi:hypothetical protein
MKTLCKGITLLVSILIVSFLSVGTVFPQGEPIPNGDFETNPAGYSFNYISDWDNDSRRNHGNPPIGDDLETVDDYYYEGDKSLYSYLQTDAVPPWPGDNVVTQSLMTEDPIRTSADYISLWIGGDDYTTSSRYYWGIQLQLSDGTNTYTDNLRCDCWGLNEGCNPNHYDYYATIETGADGRTWKRYTREIPGSICKSNLTIRIVHRQASWDLTQASSWYRLDNIYFSDSEGIPHVTTDADADGLYYYEDNCPNTPNGPSGGTCTNGNSGASCTMPGDNTSECGINGFCSMDQEDTYPPWGNRIGDACECEADFERDGDVDAQDVGKFLEDFGRNAFFKPCPTCP